MTDLDRRSRDVFIAAIEKPPSEWSSYLEINCESEELRNKVQALLDAHLNSGDFLAETAMEAFPNLSFPFGGQIEEFRIIRLIGKGGMGHVYLAKDTVLERLVALKVVGCSASSSAYDEVFDRFRREARAAARLIHPSIVQVFRTGEKDGLSYIAMEYVNGKTLHEKLELDAESTEIKSAEHFRDVANLISQIADAIENAHRAGVIHRDIKPSNILIDSDGKARLADFGVARIINEETLQRPGAIIGSVAYMSPEQARVLQAEVDHRSDIFSLGVVLYEAISLQRPFEGTNFNDVLRALSDCNPKPLKKIVREIPHDLSVICHKAIEKNVIDRYQSAAHFFADLRCFIDQMPILARPPSAGRRLRNWAKKHQGVAVGGVISILTVGVIWLALAYQSTKRSQMGRLIVPARHDGAFVTVERYSNDLRSREVVANANTPIDVFLSPGLYRVTIKFDNTQLQATSIIQAKTVDIVEVNSPSTELFPQLVEIPGGTYQIGSDQQTHPLSVRRSTTVPTFRISPTEVSNREYREYVLATKAPIPRTWPTPYERAIDDLPVTGITWDEANLYCRWRGVRMPTPDEWEVASLGSWGNEFSKEIRRLETAEFDFAEYRRFASPVYSDPHLATPRNVKHMHSNVQEYTEGIAVDNNYGIVIKGRSWASSPYFEPGRVLILSNRKKGALDRGFRIATSANYER